MIIKSNPDGKFPTTSWSIVARVQHPNDEVRKEALNELCQIYWPPVYTFARSKGNSAHDAEDLTQSFFSSLLERKDFEKIEASKGKLRNFILASLNNHMITEWRKVTRQKRGGGQAVLSLDLDEAEARYHPPEPVDGLTPAIIFHRQWAITLLEQALARLEERYAKGDRERLFEALKPALTPGAPMKEYSTIAPELGMTVTAIKVTVCRMKQRYGQLVKEALADTLGPGEDPNEELRQLLKGFE